MKNGVGGLLQKCAEIGYRISLNGDKIRFDFIGEVMPPDAVIAPLVNSLKERKLEVVEFLRQGDYEAVFNKAVGEVQGKYKGGEIAFARMNKPELIHDSLEAENRINDFWGNDSPGFQQAIVEWKEIQLEMIKLYKDSHKYLCTCGKPGERLMLDAKSGKYGGHWYCLKCRPYQNT